MPALAGDVEAARAQVLAEASGWDVATERVGEGRGVLVRGGGDRLVLAAVVLAIGLHVRVQAAGADRTGPSTGRSSMAVTPIVPESGRSRSTLQTAVTSGTAPACRTAPHRQESGTARDEVS